MWLKLTKHGDLPVPDKVRRKLLEAGSEAHPEEACGLLLGRAGRITVALRTRNVHPEPLTHFEIDPQALVDAHRAEREGGMRIMGYFHSHPRGEPHPSETDRAMSAGDHKVWAIVAGERMMFWRDYPDRFYALTWTVTGRFARRR